MDGEVVRVTVNFIGTNFRVIASSHSETLLSAMDITIAVNTDREIDINITIRVLGLLSSCQNSYYQIIFIFTLILLFLVCCCNYVGLFEYDICSCFYSRNNISEILQLYAWLHLNAYYNYTCTNIHFIVVLINPLVAGVFLDESFLLF